MPKPFDDAREQARQRLDETRDRARVAAEEARERVREANDRAVILAREAAHEAQERARQIAETMPPGLLNRLGSSLIAIPLLLALVFIEVSPEYPGVLFTFGLAIVALLGASEYFRALRLRHFRPAEAPGFLAVAVLQFAAWNVSRGKLTAFLPLILAVVVMATLIGNILRKEQEPIANSGVTFFGVVYVGWLLSYLIQIRSITGVVTVPPFPSAPTGAWLVIYVMAVTWLTDTGAYFVGACFGKTKLAPLLSPNKTREGALGGLAFSTVGAVLLALWIQLPWWHGLVLGPLLGALGQVGDLCESALKRDLGIKDFGGIMPGHGGVLDRFDSILFTAPIAYYYLTLFHLGS